MALNTKILFWNLLKVFKVKRGTIMKYIGERNLTPSQAHKLVSLGFILTLVKFMTKDWDIYRVFVR